MSTGDQSSAASTSAVPAVVMNMYYTGLGIARSLGERGVPVIGLSATRGVYGNFTRYARIIRCGDSREEPELLLRQLLELSRTLGQRAVLFPTRDHDLVFLERFRAELEPHYSLVMPSSAALERCLNKWETYVVARATGISTPRSWIAESLEEVRVAADQISFPCVLKPLAAHHWRSGVNWELVGARKAISIASRHELLAEYATTARADRRVLIQELVPGGDDCLVIAACYVDRSGRFRGGFNTQKVVQSPALFGTGCIVQSADRPELFERTIRLLQALEFTGIAEVEYKRDAADGDYKLIEVNPRPWDQHRLGSACGVDLVYLAYCDHAGLPVPEVRARFTARKWIAEDTLLLTLLRTLWRREGGVSTLLHHARGRRQFAIWSVRDPLPALICLASVAGTLARAGAQVVRRALPGPTPAARRSS